MSLETVDARFRITGIVGRGNMGEVHRAEDLRAAPDSPHREVAVKTVLRSRTGIAVDTSGSTREFDRFRREVRIMRMLSQGHPNLTRLIDGGVDGTPGGSGLPYLAMELLDGHPLADLIDEEPQLPVSWVAAIGAQIAAGLTAAHTAGVVHRDLKPANVMLTRDGTVKILDFGMGSIVDDPDQTRLTSTGVSVGTARYMAPEQFRAEHVSGLADLYALGCILYELLVGQPPFSARTPYELSEQHQHSQPPLLTLVRPDLPVELVRLVDRLLEKKAELRPENAALLHDVLVPLAQAADDTAALLAPHWVAMDPVARLRTLLPERTPAAPVPVPRREPRLPETMDVFGIHADLINEYESFTKRPEDSLGKEARKLFAGVGGTLRIITAQRSPVGAPRTLLLARLEDLRALRVQQSFLDEPLHGGSQRRPATASRCSRWRSAVHPADKLRDAGAHADPAGRPVEPDPSGRGPAVPPCCTCGPAGRSRPAHRGSTARRWRAHAQFLPQLVRAHGGIGEVADREARRPGGCRRRSGRASTTP
ncbi:serine/threonine-protein kinase [Streptomyces parvus]|uniref:serine/threonine-protein kinase n=1 Tax=Streptomyces parvus TaxID=66428 RepID=UPI0033BAC975